MFAKPCPRCGKSTTVNGSAAIWQSYRYFQPVGIRWLDHLFWRFGRSTAVMLLGNYQACVDCGLVWSNLSPDELHTLLEREGIDIGVKGLEPEIDG